MTNLKQKALKACPICQAPVLVMLYAEDLKDWICDDCVEEVKY